MSLRAQEPPVLAFCRTWNRVRANWEEYLQLVLQRGMLKLLPIQKANLKSKNLKT